MLGGIALEKRRTRDLYINPTDALPLMNVLVISQGVPVGPLLRDRLNVLGEDKRIKTTTQGQNQKARISCTIYDKDQGQLENLTNLLAVYFYAHELGINPHDDKMQFRGCDPPTFPEAYTESSDGTIFRGVVDFFVEYLFSWTEDYPVIREVELEIGERPNVFHAVKNGKIYSLDVIISR